MDCIKCKKLIQEKCGFWKGRPMHLDCLEMTLEAIGSATPLMETIEPLDKNVQCSAICNVT